MRKTIDCLFVFSYGVGETRRVMDERPPSQVAASRLLLVLFSPPLFPASNNRAGQSTVGTHSHTLYVFFIEAAGWLRGREGAAGGRGGWERGQ